MSILTICEILKHEPQNLPIQIQSIMPYLIEGLTRLFCKYKKSLEERSRVLNGEISDDDWEEGSSIGDNDDTNLDESSLEHLSYEASQHVVGDDDDDYSEAWEVEEFLQEDLSFSTVLDKIDCYLVLKETMNLLALKSPNYLNLNENQKNVLSACINKRE